MLTINPTPNCATLSMALHIVPLIVLSFSDWCDIMNNRYEYISHVFFQEIGLTVKEKLMEFHNHVLDSI